MATKTKSVKKSVKGATVPSGRRRKGVSVSLMQTKAEEQKAKQTRTDFWKPGEGKNVIRLLPPWAEDGPSAELFYRETYIHWNVPPGAAETSFMLCPKKMDLGKCYVCDQVDYLYASKDPADIELAKEIRSRQRFFSNIIDMSDALNKDGNPKVQVWSYGPMIFDELLGYFCDADYGDITDPDEGFNITIERDGQGRDTTYKMRLSRHPSSFVDNDLKEDGVYDGMKNLDQLETIGEAYKLLEYDAQQAKYEGEDAPAGQIGHEEDLEDEDEDLEDEDEDLEDEDEDLEDEDEDLEDEDEDEDLEDEVLEDEDEADDIEAKLKAAVKSRKQPVKAPAAVGVKKRRKS